MVHSFCSSGSGSPSILVSPPLLTRHTQGADHDPQYQRNVGQCEHVSELSAGYLRALNQLNTWMSDISSSSSDCGCHISNVTLSTNVTASMVPSLANNRDFQKLVTVLNSGIQGGLKLLQ